MQLMEKERAKATIGKYTHDIRAFAAFLGGREATRLEAIAWKDKLNATHMAASVNSMLAAANGFFSFFGVDIKVEYLKVQKKTFLSDEEELTQEEYERLLEAAWNQGNERLCFAMQTICATGIRVTELQHVTVESLARGCAVIENKGKIREILLGGDVVESLRGYTKKHGVKSGPVFVTKSGQPLHRGTIWAEMKALCESAGVDESKVYPHNLRRHFAVRFYATTGDFAKLADILGHSDHRTTRIYLRESGAEHRRLIDSLGLVKYRHVT